MIILGLIFLTIAVLIDTYAISFLRKQRGWIEAVDIAIFADLIAFSF